ncbi:PTS fructose transporter subunit IIC [Actinotalea sp. K2]|uniref:PTS fructose transporter subunit IIC n=1 Tax=Actinotalea sp. K2 TaxID=2939438 RepID=UPI0020174462|nr:fructose-specific PTS transporter subunit EIIC [Actinotalea sp. K2]MCL3859957.1 fructose-specific PTS transporter subunit EIIC [Actinotalea sp. K2]
MKFVGVSSCPTGIAHTYMAAEALEQAALAAGHEMHVETQGAAGSVALDPQLIAEADAVVFAADLEVKDRERFAGKPIVDVGVKKAVHDPTAVIAAAVEAAEAEVARVAAGGAAAAPVAAPATKVSANAGTGARIRQWLMTGVSYMIPFVAAGGILIALSFMIGGYEIVDTDIVTDVIEGFSITSSLSWGALLFHVGAATFAFLVPVLAGFIAYAIADRPGLAPGFVGGALALVVGAGFLGGLAAGFIGGFIALWISRWKVPKGVRGVMPVVVTPLIATFLTGLAMLVVVGPPLKAVSDGLTSWLGGLSGSNLILLGVLLGLMMAFDMGGPVNKVAYAFAATGLTAAGTAALAGAPEFRIMAAVMAAGMTPPLGLALATAVRGALFTEAERENGKAAWLLGASFITEGAIPFAAADPLRVIPSLMLGSGITGGIVMAFGSGLRAPHGGVWVTPLISQPFGFIVAVIVGTVITALAVILVKGLRRPPATDAVVAGQEDRSAVTA